MGNQGYADILAVKSRLEVRGRGGGTEGFNGCPDSGILDAFQQRHRVHKLVLFHIGFAKGDIQLCGGICVESLGEGNLSLGVVPVGLVLVGKLNGNIFVPPGVLVGQVVEPGGQAGVPVQILIACLRQEHIPGKVPVINKQVPPDAGDDQRGHQHGDQNSEKLFHKQSPFRKNFIQLYYKM